MRPPIRRTSLALAAVLVLAACGDDDTAEPAAPVDGSPERIVSIAPCRLARATSASVSTRQVWREPIASSGDPGATPGGGGPMSAPVSRPTASTGSRLSGSRAIRSTARGPVWAVLK